jgi:IS5 family transposase
LGYETLVQEVTDSLHWRRFCHLALDALVPHPTTLSQLTRKYGPVVVHELNRLLFQRAAEQKLLRSRKSRVETTVHEPIDYPTEIGLLAGNGWVMTRTVPKLQAAGVASRTTFRSPAWSTKRALATVSHSLRLRTGDAKTTVLTQTARVLRCIRQISRQGQRVLGNSHHLGRHVHSEPQTGPNSDVGATRYFRPKGPVYPSSPSPGSHAICCSSNIFHAN